MKQIAARLISNHEVMPGTHLIWLECPEIATTAKPGQFIMVRCGEDTLLRRPLSVHQVDEGKMALLFAIAGKGTGWLSQCKTDDSIDIFGPLGNGYTLPDTPQHILLVAGGIGIAPLYFLAQEALRENCSVTLLLGASNADQLYPETLLPSGIKLITTTVSPDGQKGIVTELLPDFSRQADQVFACGPTPMYREMAKQYHQLLKHKSVQVSLEVRMGCGLGVCYGCTIKTKKGLRQICKDGPVFNLEDILWDNSSL